MTPAPRNQSAPETALVAECDYYHRLYQEAAADAARLQEIIGNLYMQRGKEANKLRAAIRRAFFEARQIQP